MGLYVHPHFHGRRTGITRHVEEVVVRLALRYQARAVGRCLAADVPRIGIRSLWRAARLEPVVFHAHRNLELLAGLVLRTLRPKIRVVFTRHASTVPSAWTRLLVRRADRVIALTPQVATALGVPSQVISHGVDLQRFCPPEDRLAAWRGLSLDGELGVGVVGRIRPDKGQGDLVKALSPLLAAHPRWRAVLVGRVKPRDLRFAEELRRESAGRVALVPEQADIGPWYRGLSVLVHPSHNEAFSMVLLEALASGCCVVASALPHVPEVIEHGRTGFLYPPGDVEALRAILARLLACPEEAAEVGRVAAAEARRRFGLDGETSALLSLYEQVLEIR